GADKLLAWLPGMSRAIYDERCANFAETLAKLLDAGTPLEEALDLAAAASGDAGLAEGARALAASPTQGPEMIVDGRRAARVPPFLRYAVWHSEATIGRTRALRMAAGLYRESAQHYVERMR